MNAESEPRGAEECDAETVPFGDLVVTRERRAYLARRLTELMRDFQKLEELDSPEIEPAMTPLAALER